MTNTTIIHIHKYENNKLPRSRIALYII